MIIGCAKQRGEFAAIIYYITKRSGWKIIINVAYKLFNEGELISNAISVVLFAKLVKIDNDIW